MSLDRGNASVRLVYLDQVLDAFKQAAIATKVLSGPSYYLVIQLCVVPPGPATLVGDSVVLILGLACSHASETLEFLHKAGAKLDINPPLSLEITRPPSRH